MTQPYQPQQYQPQPQYGAPQGTPWMPQQYGGAPAQQQAAPPMGGQALPTQAPALGVGTRTGEGGPKFPQPRHLIGRTVIFEPIRIDESTTVKDDNGNDVSRPTAHYHLTVVDGGPLEYGDNKSQKIADQHGFTMRTEVPARFVNVSSDRWGIVQEVRDAMARGNLATVGVIEQGTRGTKGSPPFLVTKPGVNIDGKDRPDGDQRFALATAVWNDVFAKTFRSPEPVSLVAPPAQQPPQVAYQPVAPVQQFTGVQQHPAQMVYPQPGSDNGGAYGPYATPYGAANPGHGPYGDGPGPQYAPPVPPSAQPGYGQNPAYEAWLATLPPEQQAAMRRGEVRGPSGPGF